MTLQELVKAVFLIWMNPAGDAGVTMLLLQSFDWFLWEWFVLMSQVPAGEMHHADTERRSGLTLFYLKI